MFILTFVLLVSNIGIGLIALAIIIVPTAVIHFTIALRLECLRENKFLVVFSALNFFIFALIRPDGIHTFNKIGIETILDVLNISWHYSDRDMTILTFISILLLIIQLIVDVILHRRAKRVMATEQKFNS